MESPAASAHRGLVPWLGLLLAASLLTFWSLPTTAQLTIESVPPNAAEGKDVLLLVHNLPGDLRGYVWYKGETVDSNQKIVSYNIDTQATTHGPAYSDQMEMYTNGSLLFQNVTLKDTGMYMLLTVDKNDQNKPVTGQLHVYPVLPKPSITSNNSNPKEHKDPVMLTCEPQTENTTYLWLINSQSLQDSARLQLSMDNRTLTLLIVTRNDMGPYECENQNPGSAGRSDPFTLNVLYGPDTPTISPSDSHYLRGTNLSLSCQAASNPPAQYSWLINESSQQPTQELFISNITLKNSGSYTCLAHNSVTGLTRASVKTVTVYEPVGKPTLRASNAAVTENKDTVVLTCLTNDMDISIRWLFKNQNLLLSDRMKLSRDNSTLTIDPVRREDAGGYQCEVFNPVSSGKSDPFRLDVQSSLLTFWSLPSTAQLTIESVPPNAAEGKEVLLRVHNLPEDLERYAWYKGEVVENSKIVSYKIVTQSTNYGPAYSGRETIYPNGSLLLQNVTLKDTGKYILQVMLRDYDTKQVTGQLRVYPVLHKPRITSNNSNPEEHKDPVMLTCELQTENTTYLWLINSQRLQDIARLQLSKDNRNLTLLLVTRNDMGPYECETKNPVSAGRSDPFTLNVLCGPDTPSISPSNSHYLRGTNLSLSCQAACNPPARYSWIINGGPQQHTQELFIPNITAHDSGSYICLAHNSITGLTRTTVKTITVYEPVRKPALQASNATVTEHKEAVVLTCLSNDTGISIRWLFKNQILSHKDRKKLSQGNSILTIDPVRREDAGGYQCEVFNPINSSKSDPFRLDVQYDPTLPSPGLSDGDIVDIMVGTLIGVVLIAALVCFLCIRETRGASDQRDLTEHKPSASNHSEGHSDNPSDKLSTASFTGSFSHGHTSIESGLLLKTEMRSSLNQSSSISNKPRCFG
ncbi:carcinoembryonic antigen-related cell adhesion molecule 1 isoform X13 [Pipistrellus kuhlii]|uniref:carcinoembryonic antigen-related cell adhesion molecule 1 isoform X13 n=1 Tax=Pipistrellus kuhlii TaxID=59472 RepID=UPI001E274203|nr:carcinoembryonic antigen-related cell adhesion molecule 1 isoform X13 [Pipistrellus kuhlii]